MEGDTCSSKKALRIFPEQVCYALDPLYFAYAKLFIVQINNLKNAPQIPNSHFIETEKHYMRPVNNVEVVGVVILQKRSTKLIKFTVDDGTGIINCLVFLGQGREEANDAIDNDCKLGKMVKIRGKLKRMSEEYISRDVFASANEKAVYREIIVENVFEVINPNEELFLWTEMVKLSKIDYCTTVPKLALKYMEAKKKVLAQQYHDIAGVI